MNPARFLTLAAIGAILGVSWIALAIFNPNSGSGPVEYAALGYLFGTMFGQTTLAAAWTALGPFRWYMRLVLALLWIAIVWVCLSINIATGRGPEQMLLLLAACMLGQWMIVQMPLWGLALGYRLHLQHRSEIRDTPSPDGLPRQLQFGIRQLLILTTIVAIVLAALRALVLAIVSRLDDNGMGEGAIFIFLAVAAIVTTLPLVIAALLPRFALPATLVILVLIALATLWELPLLSLLPKTAGP